MHNVEKEQTNGEANSHMVDDGNIDQKCEITDKFIDNVGKLESSKISPHKSETVDIKVKSEVSPAISSQNDSEDTSHSKEDGSAEIAVSYNGNDSTRELNGDISGVCEFNDSDNSGQDVDHAGEEADQMNGIDDIPVKDEGVDQYDDQTNDANGSHISSDSASDDDDKDDKDFISMATINPVSAQLSSLHLEISDCLQSISQHEGKPSSQLEDEYRILNAFLDNILLLDLSARNVYHVPELIESLLKCCDLNGHKSMNMSYVKSKSDIVFQHINDIMIKDILKPSDSDNSQEENLLKEECSTSTSVTDKSNCKPGAINGSASNNTAEVSSQNGAKPLQINTKDINLDIEVYPYECTICNERFPLRAVCTSHMRKHREALFELRIHRCQCCRKSFSKDTILAKHIKLVHIREETYRCHKCTQVFTTWDDLVAHSEVHRRVVIKKEVQPTLKKRSRCEEHASVPDLDEPCEKCEAAGNVKKKKIMTPKKVDVPKVELPKKCDICPYRSDKKGPKFTKTYLYLHLAKCEDPAPVNGWDKPCDKCNTSITMKEKEIATPNGKEIATPNGKEIATPNGNTFHSMYHIDAKNSLVLQDRIRRGYKAFQCTAEDCSKSFKKGWVLKRHNIIHSEYKPFKCETCGKAYAQSNHLKSHNRIHMSLADPGTKVHTEKNQNQCIVCNKVFTNTLSLKWHARRHIKNLQCSFCKYRTYRKDSLIAHEKKHTGEKPYACSECDEAFINQGRLEAHERRIHEITHTSEKPKKTIQKTIQKTKLIPKKTKVKVSLKCKVCKKVFKYRGVLLRHLKGHEDDEDFDTTI